MALDRKIALSIQANTKKAEADIKRLQSQLTRLSSVKLGAVQTSKLTTGLKNAGQQAKRTSTQMERLGSRVNAAFNIAIVIGFTAAVAKAGDSILNLSNRLRSSGVEAKALGQNVAFTLRTANATRTSFQSAGTLLARMTRSTRTLGFGMGDVQKATTAVIQGFQLAGATTAEATQSVIQLSQGLSSGALRGDELRSVLEGAPVIANAIAKELGVGVGQLREMGKEGKITSEVVMNALLNDADNLNGKFAEMKPTFEGAFQVFKNGFATAVGETANILGDALGIKEAFIRAGSALTEAFLDGRIKVFVGEFVRDFREASARIKGFFADTFDSLGLELPDLTDILAGLATLLGVKALAGVRKGVTAFTPVRADVTGLDTEVKTLRTNLNKPFKTGELDAKPLTSGLATVREQVAALRKNLRGGFKLGATTNTEGGSAGIGSGGAAPVIIAPSGGSDDVAKKIGKNLGKVEGFNKAVRGFSTSTNAFFAGLSAGLDGYGKQLDTTVNKITPLITGQTSVHKEAQTAVNKHQTEVNKLSNRLDKLGRAYDGLADKDFGTEQEKSLAKRMDATSEKLNASRGRLEAAQKAFAASTSANVALSKATQQGLKDGFGKPLQGNLRLSQALYKGMSTTIKTLTPAMKTAMNGVGNAVGSMAKSFTTASTSIARSAGVISGSMSTLSGQIGGVATVSLLLPELTVKDEDGKFQTSIVEALDNAIEGAFAAFGFEDTKIGSQFASDLLTQVSLAIGLFAGGAAFFGLIQTAVAGIGAVILGALALPIIAIPAAILAFLATAWAFQKANLDEKIEAISSDLVAGFLRFFGVDSDVAKDVGDAFGATLDLIFLPLKTIGILVDEIINGGTIFDAFDRIKEEFKEAGKGLTDAVKKVFTFENIINFSDAFADLRSRFIAGFLKFFGAEADTAKTIGDTIAVLVSPIQLAKVALDTFKATAEAIKKAYETARTAITNTIAKIKEFGEMFVGGAIDTALGVIGTIGNAWDKVTSSISGAVKAVKEFFGVKGHSADNPATNFPLRLPGETPQQQMVRTGDRYGAPLIKKAAGGYISGAGTGTSDDIPAMLSNGEYVIKASSVSKFGAGFMAKINAGIMPQMFSKGGGVKANPEALQRLYDEQAIDTKKVGPLRKGAGSHLGLTSASDRLALEALEINIAERNADIAKLEAQNKRAAAGAGAGPSSAPTSTPDKPEKSEAAKIGESYAKKFQNDFNSGLKQLLRDGDVKGFLDGILDSFTGGIIDSVVDGFTGSLFGKSTEKGGVLSSLFSGMFDFGSGVKDGVQKSTLAGVQAGGEGGFLSGISGFFSNMFKGLGDMFKGGGAGGGGGGFLSGLLGMGGGGGLFSSIFGSSFGSVLGFSQGGVVPNTPFSQTGKDSVPAMLMPGEVVLSKNDVSRMDKSNQTSTQNFSINVTGDVDRQTRKQIVKMMPQIASGVNMTNKENNFRR